MSNENSRAGIIPGRVGARFLRARLAAACPLRVCLLLAFLPWNAAAQQPVDKRAPRPDWTSEAYQTKADIFFDNAFEALDGPRPAHLMPNQGLETASNPRPMTGAHVAETEASHGWSQLISAETLESQIKSLIQALQVSVKSPARFAGGQFRQARQEFGYLATLFRVVGAFDGDVRWKQSALAASKRSATAAAVCRSGDAAAFAEAKFVRGDLADLLNGGRLEGTETASWNEAADRGGWMRWIEAAEQRIKAAVADKNSFTRQADQLVSDAEMLRLVAQVLTEDDLEDGSDEDYEALCEALKVAASDLLDSTRAGEQRRAAEAAARVNQSCINCHEMYKG